MGQDFEIDDSPSGLVWQSQQVFICDDLEQENRFHKASELLREHRVRSLCVLPLTTPAGRSGALTIGRAEPGGFDEEEVGFAKLIAAQVALAVENALFRQRSTALQRELTRERDRLQLVLELNNAVVSNLELRALFIALSANLRRIIALRLRQPFSARRRRPTARACSRFPDSRGYLQQDMLVNIDATNAGTAFRTGHGLFVGTGGATVQRRTRTSCDSHRRGISSRCCLSRCRATVLPLAFCPWAAGANRPSRAVIWNLRRKSAARLRSPSATLSQHRALSESKEQISEQKSYLEDEIRAEQDFEDIIGGSSALRAVLDQVETVAPTDSTVLICGETGTGKELIARAIHERSARRNRTFVKINCAAIPLGLLESELFGHEKGAFTGAITRKIGRFELAHQGSLFLDEVGDIPPELQPKLLRVLQEQEFERLGSTRTQRVDVRMIAATNHKLPADGRGRKVPQRSVLPA